MPHDTIEVLEAATLKDLLAIDSKLDLIVLDLGLPDSKGVISLLDVARERPRVRILVVSGNEASDIEARVAALGAVGFVHAGTRSLGAVSATRLAIDHRSKQRRSA